MTKLVERTEERRAAALKALDPREQKAQGQYFTPAEAAVLVASLPQLGGLVGRVRVLDPGAGAGSLSAALIDRIRAERPELAIHLVAVESDPSLIPFLEETLRDCSRVPGVTTELVEGDYLVLAIEDEPDTPVNEPFDLVIMNPPYGKLASTSPHRRSIAEAYVDTPNLYAAFWTLGVAGLREGGQCVAIVPRSWANGTYFENFRKWLLDHARLDTLHVFDSRNTVFKDTGVLQENVIVSVSRGATQEDSVVLSASVGHTDDVQTKSVPARAVVQPGDRHSFVRFTDGATSVPHAARFTLDDLGIGVSTGRVVDFRCREFLVLEPSIGLNVPLIYPGNLKNGRVVWPRRIGKPQGYNVETSGAQKWLTPEGVYTLTKRFSAKEERRRIVAAVSDLPGPVAFENHLNYFHENGAGLSICLAQGLALWLNSTSVDLLFRTFSGHTQVNAGDLKSLPYPSRADLEKLGRLAPSGYEEQDAIDDLVTRVLCEGAAVAS